MRKLLRAWERFKFYTKRLCCWRTSFIAGHEKPERQHFPVNATPAPLRGRFDRSIALPKSIKHSECAKFLERPSFFEGPILPVTSQLSGLMSMCKIETECIALQNCSICINDKKTGLSVWCVERGTRILWGSWFKPTAVNWYCISKHKTGSLQQLKTQINPLNIKGYRIAGERRSKIWNISYYTLSICPFLSNFNI